MAIPDYQTLMLPLLRRLADEKEHALRDVVASLADQYRLTPDERRELLPSGTQPTFNNRVAWAKTYLKKAGLIEQIRRGVIRISSRGLEVLRGAPPKIDVGFLERFPEFVTFRSLRRERVGEEPDEVEEDRQWTPEEALGVAYRRLREDLESELLDQVKATTPSFFERLVVNLLVAMGYGGSIADAGRAVGRGGDGGIDGIIKEDRLGLDVIYVQAKRLENTVGRPDIQKFAGALQGHRARKGVFITTSAFTKDAYEYASAIESKIILIDGAELAKLMIDHNVGVSSVRTYEIKKIDSDYFIEGEA